MTTPRAILAGFAEDLVFISSNLESAGVCFMVDEETLQVCELPKVELIVYVFSKDTGYSSQLLSWFTWIHHNVGVAEECVLRVGDHDLTRSVFDFAKGLSVASVEEVQEKLRVLNSRL